MRTFVSVMTHNPLAELRYDALSKVVRSIDEAFPGAHLQLLDNGSDDGSEDALSALTRGERWVLTRHHRDDKNHTPGAGHNAAVRQIEHLWDPQHGDVIVACDDDMCWHPWAGKWLEDFWPEAPANLLILCGQLEPEYRWNTPTGTVESGGKKALCRASAPGAGWTFRYERWLRYIAPVPAKFGYDFDVTNRLTTAGYRVAQADLGVNLGDRLSTHGNNAPQQDARPLNRAKWGV